MGFCHPDAELGRMSWRQVLQEFFEDPPSGGLSFLRVDPLGVRFALFAEEDAA